MDEKTRLLAEKILGELRKISHALSVLGKNLPPETIADATASRAGKPQYRWFHRFFPSFWWNVARASTRKEILEVIGIFSAVIYAGITYNQWQEMKTQTVAANRAWLDSGVPTYAAGTELVIGLYPGFFFPHKNVGHDPVIDPKISIYFDTVAYSPGQNYGMLPGMKPGFCQAYPPDTPLGFMFPGGDGGITIPSTVPWDDVLASQRRLLRVQGCYSYTTFGKTHYTWFCDVFVPTQDERSLVATGCDGGGVD